MTWRVVVLGTKGQLAHALAEIGPQQDIELIFVGRPDIDFTAPEDAVRVIAEFKPDAIVNAAAYTQVDQAEDEAELAFQINAAAPRVLADWAATLRIPLIHVSTDYVFDGTKSSPYVEGDQTNAVNKYGESKLAGEIAIRESNADALIIRTSWLYSAFGSNFVKTMLRLAVSHEKIRVVSDQFGSPTAACELAQAILIALAKRKSETRFEIGLAHFAGHGGASWYDVAIETFSTSSSLGGPHADVEPITTAQYPTKALRPKNSNLDPSLFETRFDHHAPGWRLSLAEVVRTLVVAGPSSFDGNEKD